MIDLRRLGSRHRFASVNYGYGRQSATVSEYQRRVRKKSHHWAAEASPMHQQVIIGVGLLNQECSPFALVTEYAVTEGRTALPRSMSVQPNSLAC